MLCMNICSIQVEERASLLQLIFSAFLEERSRAGVGVHTKINMQVEEAAIILRNDC